MVRDTTLDVDRIPAHYPRPWNLQSVLIFSFLTDAQESSSSFNINADYEICTCGEQRQPYLRVYYSLSLWGDQSQPLGIYCNSITAQFCHVPGSKISRQLGEMMCTTAGREGCPNMDMARLSPAGFFVYH